MLITIEKVLSTAELAHFRQQLAGAHWADGGATAGSLARAAKRNQQLQDGTEPAVALGSHILRRLGEVPRFMSAALPNRIHPPRFNRYAGGGTYGTHVDGAVMYVPSMGFTMRSDISATLFLTEPGDYDGGELEIETAFGAQAVKLAAGDLVLYPASSLHRVTPVTRGERIAAFFWVESLVADGPAREQLFDLDEAIQALGATVPATDPTLVKFSGIYHNLLRRWART
jgi:PKHD-type hydroxylase